MSNEPVNLEGLNERDKSRVRALQELLRYVGTSEYVAAQKRVAQRLGLSVRSVQRLLQRWRAEGLRGVVRKGRSDRGKSQLSETWREYILATWREGNKDGRRLSRAQVYVRVRAHASEQGMESHPSHMSVYRLLGPEIEKARRKGRVGSIGWRGNRLKIRTKGGIEIDVDHSNQVWQADHTQVDVLVVDQSGAVLGRPWLTLVVDSYSRCLMGFHLGMEGPSASVVCLGLRHGILPKRYSGWYGLVHRWGTYGVPSYLYTDNGKDFRSSHVEQVANELGIVLCHRRYPSDGGIVERPFGTLNSELFSSLPGYTSGSIAERPKEAEREACLSLWELERLIVRYIVDRYNQKVDARMGDQSRIARWDGGCSGALAVLGERELDICLMRRESRRVYRRGYLQFANLVYRGDCLEGYAGEQVVIRYNPRDITTLLVYQEAEGQDVFVARAHAQDLETEQLSLAEAKATSRRIREQGRLVSNQSILSEVVSRDRAVSRIQQEKQQGSDLPVEPRIHVL
ncbi:MAG: DDE-type integrase/transposase/recombinase [Cyanothece sp. SIO2G6]|nr:DDE-type integrase/transposase/recombinase [Cyanothece sp. SIO2G6]